MIEIIFTEAAFLVTVSETSKMKILLYEMQPSAWIIIITGDKILIFRFYSFCSKNCQRLLLQDLTTNRIYLCLGHGNKIYSQ